MILLKIDGRAFVQETRIPLASLVVEALDRASGLKLGHAITSRDGTYAIEINVGPVLNLGSFCLRLSLPGKQRILAERECPLNEFYTAGSSTEFAVPRSDLGTCATPRTIVFVNDSGDPIKDVDIGEILRIRAKGLAALTAHDVEIMCAAERLVFKARAMTDEFGQMNDALLWPLVGMNDPETGEVLSIEVAQRRWAGETLTARVTEYGHVVCEASITVLEKPTRPFVFVSSEDGMPRSVASPGSELVLTGYEFRPAQELRVLLVQGHNGWKTGDRFSEVFRADISAGADGGFRVPVDLKPEIRSGRYDIVVRHLTYGLEDNDLPSLREDDLVTFHSIPGVTVLDQPSSVVRDSALRHVSMEGRRSRASRHVHRTNVFRPGEEIWASIDDGLLSPKDDARACELFLIERKSPAEWRDDKRLNHLRALGDNGAAPRFMARAGGSGWHLAWPKAEPGEYEIIAKLGALDGKIEATFDQRTDFIDGYAMGGFRVLTDPVNVEDFAHCGVLTYDDGTETVTDNLAAFDVYAGETGQLDEIDLPVRGIVYFPSDVEGATDPNQVSTQQSSFPIFMIIHGANNSQESYLGYNYLLEAAAKQGFVAVSVASGAANDMQSRAEILFHNLDRVKAIFGSRVQDRIVVAGHSRGGEAVVRATQLSLNPAIDHTIEAVISIAPTDNYGRLIMGESAARPYLVIYGSHDGDVVGADKGDVTRQTGFSLYDRAYGAPKSMVFVHNAMHGPFNTVWGLADQFGLSGTDLLSTIDESSHRVVAQAYITAFLRYHILGEADYEGVVKGDWVPASVQEANEGNMTLCVQYKGLDEEIVDNMVGNPGPSGWQTSTIGGTVTDDGTLPSPPDEDWLHRIDPNSPHETGGFRLRWSGTNDRLVFSLPEALDVGGFGYLSFRVGQVVDTTANPAGPQDFFVGLRDEGGAARQIRIGSFAEIPMPAPRTDNPPNQMAVAKSSMRTVRVPLSAFIVDIDGIPPVDLGMVDEVSFHFAEIATGEIVIDAVAFADGALPPDGFIPAGVVELTDQFVVVGPTGTGLPAHPSTGATPADLEWEAREVIKKIDADMRLLIRFTFPEIRFEARALSPIVRIGDMTAIKVSPCPDGTGVVAYFDAPPPEGGVIDYGFADRGIVSRAARTFSRGTIRRLDSGKLAPDIRA